MADRPIVLQSRGRSHSHSHSSRRHHRHHRRRPSARWVRLFLFVLVIATSLQLPGVQAWELSDYLGGSSDGIKFQTETLSMSEVREMRVRDIKRRLSRTHGHSADEIGRMIDKKDLIQALAFEEHKDREKELEQVKRFVVIRGILLALLAVVVVMGWPIWVHLYETASVNFVVYTDKKKYEASRCLELGSFHGMVGVFFMGVVDVLQLWLSLSVLLSWFTSSRYFFPTPNMAIRPAQFMGDKVAKGPMAKYGLNVGPMAITWAFRYLQNQLEGFTGRALSRAYQTQKKAARDWESPEDRAARKAARKTAKKAAREDAEQQIREAEAEEAKRRRDVADKATSALFPSGMTAESAVPNMEGLLPDQKDSQKAPILDFEQDMDNLDMNDLD